MGKVKNGYFLGEKYFRNIITKRGQEIGLQPDVLDYLLQDFYNRDEILNDVSIHTRFTNIICEEANKIRMSIIETDREDLTEDFIAACCVSIYLQLEPSGIKPEEAYRWFDPAWTFTKSRLVEQERVRSIIKNSFKKKQLN